MTGISFDDFKKTTKSIIEKHFTEVNRLVTSRIYRPARGEIFLFPSTLLFTQTKTHYSLELIGAMRKQQRLQAKERQAESINQVVNNFPSSDDTRYMFTTEGNQPSNLLVTYRGMNLLCDSPGDSLQRRFPGVHAFTSQSPLIGFSEHHTYLPLNAEPMRSIILDNCMLISRKAGVARPKFANFFYACSIEADASEITRDLAGMAPVHNEPVVGVQVASPEKTEAMRTAAGFATLYLQGVRETTVTAFIEKHGGIIEKTFDADRVFYQATLPWREGNPDPNEEAIQPDILLRTKEGSWKIVEFKLPLLDKALTAGPRARRRLTHTVNDGVQQLANYEEYFTSAENLAAAREVLGEFPATPELVLVVGSDENFNAEEVREATRLHRPFDIIDYDTLMRLYLAAEE
ncbi:Shedu anti-phage system protein SduA domain-containing protein [Streptomyces sp. NPDC002250]|uniref:Shedu anti-phage system protein SduA domain-containing protein n=1 Tax=Streptomyces sp. NPDC002250 TaxID=3364641 RepID=UPI003677CCF7